jgi:predicted RNase H-like HicB family nuclease
MAEYIAVIHKDQSTEYGASFPDFPGCISVAATLEKLRIDAEEALTLYIEGMVEDGDEIPEPTRFDEIVASPDYEDAIAVLVVKSPDSLNNAVRINVTIPNQVLSRIDRYAAKKGLTRSGFLVKAAKREMEPHSS